MTIAEAAKAGGRDFERSDSLESGCHMVRLTGDSGKGPLFMVVDGKIARVDVTGPGIQTNHKVAVGGGRSENREGVSGAGHGLPAQVHRGTLCDGRSSHRGGQRLRGHLRDRQPAGSLGIARAGFPKWSMSRDQVKETLDAEEDSVDSTCLMGPSPTSSCGSTIPS